MERKFNYLYASNLIEAFINLDTIFDLECKKCKSIYHYNRKDVFSHKFFNYKCVGCKTKNTFNSREYMIKYYEEKYKKLREAIDVLYTV